MWRTLWDSNPYNVGLQATPLPVSGKSPDYRAVNLRLLGAAFLFGAAFGLGLAGLVGDFLGVTFLGVVFFAGALALVGAFPSFGRNPRRPGKSNSRWPAARRSALYIPRARLVAAVISAPAL